MPPSSPATSPVSGFPSRRRLTNPHPVWTAIALLLIVLLAAALRCTDLRDNPPGFFCDEAGLGYNAYSLLETGRDETGTRWPLYIWSFDVSYKNPVFIYSAMIPVAALGLNERAVRLTSAVYGTATVAAIFFAGRAVMGTWTGLLAALFLAVCPWHLHFSRIAFELITLPFFFVVGFTALVRFVDGRRTLPVAALFLGISLYTYAIAKLFVPLFIGAFALGCWPHLRRRPFQAFAGLAVFLAIATPLIRFDLTHHDRAVEYFRETTFLQEGMSWQDATTQFASQYAAFLSPEFLFQHGDPITRHAVTGHGELPLLFAPLLLIGLLTAGRRRGAPMYLVLAWLTAYPVGAALMTEIPSASRGILGAPVLCLLAAIGATALLKVPYRVTRRRFAHVLCVVEAALGITLLATQTWHYWQDYTGNYRSYAAKYYTGFQFGHREVVNYFQAHRHDYDRMILTPRLNNQPGIFLLFYTAFSPEAYQHGGYDALRRETGMEVAWPEEVSLAERSRQRMLLAIRGESLQQDNQYRIQARVTAPDGSPAFLLVEPFQPAPFTRNWLISGIYEKDAAPAPPRFSVQKQPHRDRAGRPWQIHVSNSSPVELKEPSSAQAEPLCVWAVNFAHSSHARTVRIFAGLDPLGSVWINGEQVILERRAHSGGEVVPDASVGHATLRPGPNLVALRTCTTPSAAWRFSFRLAALDGGAVPGIEWEY